MHVSTIFLTLTSLAALAFSQPTSVRGEHPSLTRRAASPPGLWFCLEPDWKGTCQLDIINSDVAGRCFPLPSDTPGDHISIGPDPGVPCVVYKGSWCTDYKGDTPNRKLINYPGDPNLPGPKAPDGFDVIMCFEPS